MAIEAISGTPFSKVFSSFESKVTDDMFLEMDKTETFSREKEFLVNALHWFEFPRQDIFDIDTDIDMFAVDLTREEINIISEYMVVEWLKSQIAIVDVTRMQYTGADFKMTSQANHMAKLKNMAEHWEKNGFHLQRLYKRRRKNETTGAQNSTFGDIMQSSFDRQKGVWRW
ncbi:MAG: hypothetical protein KBT06_04500 [Prevotellaceae bacterium]|nr:hypothetical protein [Candidatus Colivivens equi]